NIDWDHPPVLGLMAAFAMEVSRPNLLRETLLISFCELGSVDLGGVEAKELVVRVAQAPRRCRVGVQDPTFEVVDKYRVVDTVEQRAKPASFGVGRTLRLIADQVGCGPRARSVRGAFKFRFLCQAHDFCLASAGRKSGFTTSPREGIARP